MGTTVIGPGVAPLPFASPAPVVELKLSWSDTWVAVPDLVPEQISLASGGNDLSVCVVRRVYGSVKQPWDSAFLALQSTGLIGVWLRVRLVDALAGGALETIWVGRVSSETRSVFGSDNGETGIQRFVAYGPMQHLRKTAVSTSFWIDGSVSTIGWVPDVNGRDQHNRLVGNRSATKTGGTYLYGGTDLWSYFDYLEYLMSRFADQTADGGPAWRIGGQVATLKGITDTLALQGGATYTLAGLLSALISSRHGLDYHIIETDAGFEVSVFALSSFEVGYGGATLPKNPNTISIVASETTDLMETTITKSDDQRFSRVRVIGNRIVVCCSFEAAGAAPSLVPMWSNGLENLYKGGTGDPTSLVEVHELARQLDIYRPVYRQFGVPDDWDYNGGKAAPVLDAEGVVLSTQPAGGADKQNVIREMLYWTPMREGLDYSTDPPTNNNAGSASESDFLPPAGWLKDLLGRRISVDAAGIGLSVSATDMGVFLPSQRNYQLALNHFSGAAPVDHVGATFVSQYDWRDLIVTAAIRSDQRFVMDFDTGVQGGGVMEIEVPDAEFWYLAPMTVVGLDGNFNLQRVGETGRVLRTDKDRLAMVMAGAISRYVLHRSRARVKVRGLRTFGGLLGQILTVVEEAGDTDNIESPVTSVRWVFGDQPMTIITAGYAR